MIVIHGPGRTGKTLHARRFAKHYGCTRIVDIPDFSTARALRKEIRAGELANNHHATAVAGEGTRCLVLATEPEDYLRANFLPGTKLISIADARAAVGLEPIPEGGFRLPEPAARQASDKPLSLGGTGKRSAFYYSLADALEDAETWFGPHPSRDAAIMAGRAKTDQAFWTAAGQPMEHDLSIFSPAIASEGGAIATAFDERNGQNLGEDGESGPSWWTPDHVRDLITRLNAAFAAWATDHGYHRAWMIDVTDERREERGAR